MLPVVPQTLDIPLYVMNSNNEQALIGMDILSLGDFSASHVKDADGASWLRFQFQLLDSEWLV